MLCLLIRVDADRGPHLGMTKESTRQVCVLARLDWVAHDAAASVGTTRKLLILTLEDVSCLLSQVSLAS